jgi:putative spermidine/putrescine transport system permease protein
MRLSSARQNNAFAILPGTAVLTALFFAPMVTLLVESFRLYVPGRVGAASNAPLTRTNYAELLEPAFLRFFVETFWISLITTIVGVLLAYPIAYRIARTPSRRRRAIAIGALVTFLFLSAVVRTYALELTFGSVGPLRPLFETIGISPNSRTYIQYLVGAGLLQFIIPIAALTLIGTHQNIDGSLVEAAQALGAPRWKAHLSITVPLSVEGVLSAFLLAFTFSMSAFIVPMILGKGRILFLSNLIYNRFSETANYPSGAAISVVTLAVTLAIVYGISRLITWRLQSGAR